MVSIRPSSGRKRIKAMDMILNTFLGPSGLSRAGQEFFRLLVKSKMRVIPKWIHLVPNDIKYVSPKVRDEMIKASSLPMYGRKFCQFYVGTPNNVSIMFERKYGIASIVYETTSLSAEQTNSIRNFDIILAPSTFCRNAYLSSGINPNNLFYVPYPLNTEKWNPGVEPLHKKNDDIFRFLYMNTSFERKGIDLLILAWLQEFKKDEPVELSLKTYQEHKDLIPKNLITNIAKKNGLSFSVAAPVHLYDQAIDDDEIPGFMKSFDALVSPHRSEGFGMNPWYAMALGIPVICTNYGGTMDFAKQDLTWLIDVTGHSTPSKSQCEIFPNFKDIIWAEPDLDSLRQQMRACFNDAQARKQKAEAGAIFVKENFCDDIVQQQLKDVLEKKAPGLWEELTSTTIKVPPRMSDGRATMLEV